ncbi:MAG: DUF501 domain-containing protein [Actinomycetota bacterium]
MEPVGATTDADREVVRRLLGREPQGSFEVVVRRDDGSPVVLANQPLLDSGRPMPTRYWLVDRRLVKAVGRLESEGGVNRAEAEVDDAELQRAHDRYRVERDALIDPAHTGPRPYGGVGGTREGVKCLHAHYANHLIGADDPVGAWVHQRLAEAGRAYDPSEPAQ